MKEERELVKSVEINMKRISDRLRKCKCLEWEKENTELKKKMQKMEAKMN